MPSWDSIFVIWGTVNMKLTASRMKTEAESAVETLCVPVSDIPHTADSV
jgi:hypothetical protein